MEKLPLRCFRCALTQFHPSPIPPPTANPIVTYWKTNSEQRMANENCYYESIVVRLWLVSLDNRGIYVFRMVTEQSETTCYVQFRHHFSFALSQFMNKIEMKSANFPRVNSIVTWIRGNNNRTALLSLSLCLRVCPSLPRQRKKIGLFCFRDDIIAKRIREYQTTIPWKSEKNETRREKNS